MLLERGDDAGAEVRERTDVEDCAATRKLVDKPGVLYRTDPVPNPVGVKRVECAADRLGSCGFARVWNGPEPALARERERLRERLRRVACLWSAETDPYDAAIPVLDRVTRCREGVLE